MGIIAEFFVTRPSELRKSDLTQPPSRRFPSVEANGISHSSLAELESLVTSVAVKKLLTKDLEPRGGYFHAEGEDGPWVVAFSNRFTKDLACLSDADVKRLGEQWLGDGALPLVSNLTALARIALFARDDPATKKKDPWTVFLWYILGSPDVSGWLIRRDLARIGWAPVFARRGARGEASQEIATKVPNLATSPHG